MNKSIRLIAVLAMIASLLVVPAIPASAATAVCDENNACLPAAVNCGAGTVGFAVNKNGVGTVTANCGGVPFANATAAMPVALGFKPNNGVFSCTKTPGAQGYCGTTLLGKLVLFVFSASATVANGLCGPVANPLGQDPASSRNCGGIGLASAPAGNTGWAFDTDAPSTLARVCWGNTAGTDLGVSAGLRVNGANQLGVPSAANPACRLAAGGTLTAGTGGVGPYCGWSTGTGTVGTAVVDGASVLSTAGPTTVGWPQSAGTVLPLVFGGGGGTVVGYGAVQTTGATPGTCGYTPPGVGTGQATNAFQVTGFAAVLAVS